MIEFGKYKGMEVDDVLEEDPKYLMWCYENDIRYLVDDEMYKLACAKDVEIRCDGEVCVEY